ncbi:hypothetical protein CY34DRAFT_801448, partial [Suillus luteus UH-Slu-Lm8-n1]
MAVVPALIMQDLYCKSLSATSASPCILPSHASDLRVKRFNVQPQAHGEPPTSPNTFQGDCRRLFRAFCLPTFSSGSAISAWHEGSFCTRGDGRESEQLCPA